LGLVFTDQLIMGLIGFYRSTDYGVTFGINLNPGKNGYGILQLPINGDLYMITTTSPYNFDKSTNKGLSWTTISNAPTQQYPMLLTPCEV